MTKIVLWVSDMDAQFAFYKSLLNLDVESQSDGFASLVNASNSVLLHELPIEYRANAPLTAQLAVQEEVAIKPVFFVADLEAARDRVRGSFATFPRDVLTHGSSKFLDVVDPEGNVIQLEQRAN